MRILEPIKVIRNVTYTACGHPLKAKQVLVKYSNGREAAVILDPDRSDLLLYCPVGKCYQFKSHRWWNNTVIGSIGDPTTGPYDRGDVNTRYSFPDNIHFEYAYSAWLRMFFDHEVKPSRTTADVFLALLQGVVENPPSAMWVLEQDRKVRKVK